MHKAHWLELEPVNGSGPQVVMARGTIRDPGHGTYSLSEKVLVGSVAQLLFLAGSISLGSFSTEQVSRSLLNRALPGKPQNMHGLHTPPDT